MSAKSLHKFLQKKKSILCGYLFSMVNSQEQKGELPFELTNLLDRFQDVFQEPTELLLRRLQIYYSETGCCHQLFYGLIKSRIHTKK